MTYKSSYYNTFFQFGKEGLNVGYNSRTGKYLELPGDSYDVVRNVLSDPNQPPSSARDAQILEALLESGFLVAGEVDELDVITGRFAQLKEERVAYLAIALTQDCNFDCTYCFEDHLRGTGMTPEVKLRVLKFIASRSQNMTTMFLDWYGGEPLLEFALLKEMDRCASDICVQHDCTYCSSISTNGYLLTPDKVDELVTDTAVKSVRVSLDGPADVHNVYRPRNDGGETFDVILENLCYAAKHIHVKIRMNLDKGNHNRVGELLQVLERRGLTGPNVTVSLKRIYSSRLRPRKSAFTPREFASVEPQLKEEVITRGIGLDRGRGEQACSFCVVPSPNQFMVDWRGLLYKCSDNFDPEEKVGSIGPSGEAILDQARLQPWITFPGLNDEQCRRCMALPLCMGGCNFNRFAIQNHWCGAERYNLREYVKLRYAHRKALGESTPAVT